MDDVEITDAYSGNIDRFKRKQDHEFGRETGFPSPARDHYEKPLSLDEYLIHRPAATYFVRVKGDGLNNIGIYSDDILIVDRSVKPVNGYIVVVQLEGKNTVRKLERKNGQMFFCSGNETIKDLPLSIENHEWGGAYTIHKQI